MIVHKSIDEGNIMQLLLLDMSQGGTDTKDRGVILDHYSEVIELMLQTAEKYGLTYVIPPDYDPTAEGQFWLEIADDDNHLLTKVTFAEGVLTSPDYTEPTSEEVMSLLNDFCAEFDLGMAFSIPVPE